MKQKLTLFSIILLIFNITNSQNIVTFDDQSYIENQNLGINFSLLNNNIQFDFLLEDINGNNNFSYSETVVLDNAIGEIFFNPNFGVTLLNIKTNGGEDIDFQSIKITDYGLGTFNTIVRMEGFRDNISTGFIDIDFSEGSSIAKIIDVSNNSSFDRVDEIKLTGDETLGISISGTIDDIVWNQIDQTLNNNLFLKEVPKFSLRLERNKIYINASNKIENYKLSIYNLNGQQVFTGKSTREIDTSNLSKGIYILKINNEKVISTYKIII